MEDAQAAGVEGPQMWTTEVEMRSKGFCLHLRASDLVCLNTKMAAESFLLQPPRQTPLLILVHLTRTDGRPDTPSHGVDILIGDEDDGESGNDEQEIDIPPLNPRVTTIPRFYPPKSLKGAIIRANQLGQQIEHLKEMSRRLEKGTSPWREDILYPHQAGYRPGMTQEEHRTEKRLWTAQGSDAGYLTAKANPPASTVNPDMPTDTMAGSHDSDTETNGDPE